ncbi:radical SAM family heme chaperone HemW [Brochothrix thermosphacta]|uniref:radical SAM family heme chaperone HemW n=1 Tax=Brochothrix thermosphacta TaxID=2756 RepID=UPI00083F5562|nr:radical SAM family heme chaperone HemW [Brochothrix thermosphacta]ODJ54952.1 coproporphyrinogen III oxidase [Brochothrix thermosphacta]ODJ69813.1 coproporphyrinogen III oxidase [Brochothrix thermosphacta]
MTAVYIHIPFCEHICYYCDFNKVFLEGQPVDQYIDTLLLEMKMRLEERPVENVETIFVGGGTPTTLTPKQLDKLCGGIRELLPYDEATGEFSFEANPGDLSLDKLEVMRQHGVNRLSMGVQSFNQDLLKKIGRIHTVADVYKSVKNAHQVGFENISIDLIFSLPGQTEEDFKDTLSKALALDLPHYSAYSLIVEPKTIFYNLMQKGKLILPGQDAEANMYGYLMDTMAAHGRQQYEISNFCKPGYESRHNITYWANEEYYGFGAGAHGFLGDTRYSNAGPLKKYMTPLEAGELPTFQTKDLGLNEHIEEEMFLGLRRTKGVSISHFKEKFGKDMFDVYHEPINRFVDKGLIQVEGDQVKLSRQGRFLGNVVFRDFLFER